jgi:hypothetical protein
MSLMPVKRSELDSEPSAETDANVKEVMTAEEARGCIEQIHANFQDTREVLLELWERDGWEALGYDSWRACATKEFKGKQAYLYYQLAAAKIERNISTTVENATGAKIGTIPERHLRLLAPLSADQQVEAYRKAVEAASEGKVTAKDIKKAVDEITGKKTTPENEVPEKPIDEAGYELKHTETYPVSDAMDFAGIAISQLEKIPADDPLRAQSIQKVADWCYHNLN